MCASYSGFSDYTAIETTVSNNSKGFKKQKSPSAL